MMFCMFDTQVIYSRCQLQKKKITERRGFYLVQYVVNQCVMICAIAGGENYNMDFKYWSAIICRSFAVIIC